MIYLFLFLSFLQIGALSFGDIAGVTALLEYEAVQHHQWLTSAEFANLMATCRVLPGSFGIDAAAFTGYSVTAAYGPWAAIGGSVAATVALALPSFLYTALLEKFDAFVRHQGIRRSLAALFRPLAPGLAAAAILLLLNADNFSSPTTHPWQFGVSLFLFCATLVGTLVCRFKPIVMLLLSGLAGVVLL